MPQSKAFIHKFSEFLFAPRPMMTQVAALFLRALGALFVFHFATILPQIVGIIGSHGVSPVAVSLDYHWSVSHWAPVFNPTLAWVSSSDPFLVGLAIVGISLGIGLMLGYRHFAILFSLWIIQITFANSSMFFGFIWDLCLAQVSFASLFLAIFSFDRRAVAPRRSGVWAMRFLFFHIMFMMAFCKIFSTATDWRSFEFLKWFYANQPMPSMVSWELAQLSPRFTALFSLLTMVIEATLALVLFIPSKWKRARELCFVLSCGLQGAIFLSGNFGYFNLLMIVLSLFCVTDLSLPKRLKLPTGISMARPSRLAESFIFAALTVFTVSNFAQYILFDLNQMYSPFETEQTSLEKFLYPLITYRLMVPYNIFGTIPHTHRELIVEASDDGQTWTELSLFYGPGDLSQKPAFAAPFQWRLDHEFYYAGQMVRNFTRDGQSRPFLNIYWLEGLGNGLLAGTPEIRALFPAQAALQKTPKFLRFSVFDYRFTDLVEHERTGRWWQRSQYLQSEVASLERPVQQPWPFRLIKKETVTP